MDWYVETTAVSSEDTVSGPVHDSRTQRITMSVGLNFATVIDTIQNKHNDDKSPICW